jgi:hypothetical protein
MFRGFLLAGGFAVASTLQFVGAIATEPAATSGGAASPAVQSPTPDGKGRPMLTWDSAKLLAAKREWGALYVSFAPNDPKLGEGRRQLDAILAKRFSKQDLTDLAITCTALPPEWNDCGTFDAALLQQMFWVFLTSGDRESLVTLFSRRFPPLYRFAVTEDLLMHSRKRLRDPILILGEAYSKCQASQVRAKLAAAVRHAFAGLGIQEGDDGEFVKNAMQWYQNNKNAPRFRPDSSW